LPFLFMRGGIVPAERHDDVVLQKPFHEDDLARAIARAVGGDNSGA
jgi:hypothetical protein